MLFIVHYLIAVRKGEVARLWQLWVGDCVTVFHMLSRVCVYVHDNVRAYVYVHACL